MQFLDDFLGVLPCNADFHAIFCGRLKLLTHLARNLNLGLITTVIQDTKLTFSFNAPRFSFNLIYNLVSVANCLNIFMGLVLVHFQKNWLLKPVGQL